ncbi:hypothetical protein DW081_11185 [Clostridium sp. AF46-9NS]|nr:hypothetical protein DW081_11185 [Clostridium sp. AF46-9NS]RGF34854.1 hypothetical protein DW076_11895 [Clostridium sp. AF46-12NS]
MKFVKRISYFFVIPVVFLILGIFLGVWGIHFFYPGQWQDLNENRLALPLTEEETAADTDPYEAAPSVEAAAPGRHFVRIPNMCWKRQILYGVPQWRPHGRFHINILG